MNFKLDEFYMRLNTSLKYHTWLNMLCIDIALETEPYKIAIDMSSKFAECYKTLINCFFDWGQFAKGDNINSNKPFSPYEKLIDDCTLSSTQQLSVKTYEPLKTDSTATTWFVGSGQYDNACFPGNILIALIDFDHNLEM